MLKFTMTTGLLPVCGGKYNKAYARWHHQGHEV